MGERAVRVSRVAIACMGALAVAALIGCQRSTPPVAPPTATVPALVVEKQSSVEVSTPVPAFTPTAVPTSGAGFTVLEPYSEAELAAFKQEGFDGYRGDVEAFACHPSGEALAPGPEALEDGGFLPSTVDDSARGVMGSPSGREAGAASVSSGRLTTFTVKRGDTVSGLAGVFGISADTVRWANGLAGQNDDLQVGQVLTILPVSGVLHEVEGGDTIAGIAAAYGVDTSAIVEVNGLVDPNLLGEGTNLIVPGGEPLIGRQ